MVTRTPETGIQQRETQNKIPVLPELMFSLRLCLLVTVCCHFSRGSRWRRDKVGVLCTKLNRTLVFISI